MTSKKLYGTKRVGVLADYETRSRCNLLTSGSSVYSRHPSTEVLCLASADVYWNSKTEHYEVDRESKRLWRFDGKDDITDYLPKEGELLFAHNAQFEHDITVNTLGIPLEVEQLYCTAFMALYNGLPKKLADISKAIPLTSPKDMEGNALMMKMCKPQKDGTYIFTEEKFDRLCVYADGDIESEAESLEKLTPISDHELACYHETMKINIAGIPVDMELIKNASDMVSKETEQIAKKFPDVNMKSHTQIKAFAKEHGYIMKSTDKEHVTKALADDALPPEVRELLEAKDLGIGSSSVSKFDSLQNYSDTDNMLRNAYIHHGAIRTGRWTSVGAQIQNLPRGEKYIAEDEELLPLAREFIRNQDYDSLHMITNGRPMDALKSIVRSVFAPGPGLKFVQRDLSAIEARGVLWVAGAEGLKIFEDFDEGVGEEPYMIFANKLDTDRFMGKQGILSSGYGVGARTFAMMCDKYGRPISEEFAKECLDTYKSMFPEVKNFWYMVGDAAKCAIDSPGNVYSVPTPTNPVKFVMRGDHLLMKLPSHRVLTYWGAELQDGQYGAEISYMTHGSEGGKAMGWHRTRTWGGGMTGHIVQGFSACIMRDILLRMRTAGIPSVMTTHDEAVTIAKDKDAKAVFDTLGNIMKQRPDWAQGLPIQSAGWIKDFFIKD